MKGTNQVCHANSCESLLNPPKGSADWFNNPNYYDICSGVKEQITVPTAFYKVVCFESGEVYPVIMGHEVPGADYKGTNSEILATGNKAWAIIQHELHDYVSFPTAITQNIKDSNGQTWLRGKCPADHSEAVYDLAGSSSSGGLSKSAIIGIVVGSLCIVFLLILLIWLLFKHK